VRRVIRDDLHRVTDAALSRPTEASTRRSAVVSHRWPVFRVDPNAVLNR
jgi:hypothetical protein